VKHNGKSSSAADMLQHPGMTLERLQEAFPEELGPDAVHPSVAETAQVECRYVEYIQRQAEEMKALKRDAALPLPDGLDFEAMRGLSNEDRDRCKKYLPRTVGDAGLVPGITQGGIALLYAIAKRSQNEKRKERKVHSGRASV